MTAAPLLVLSGIVLHGGLLKAARGGDRLVVVSLVALAAGASLVALGGLAAIWVPKHGRRLVMTGLVCWFAHVVVAAIDRPLWLLAAIAGVLVAAHQLWPASSERHPSPRRDILDHARRSAFVALGGAVGLVLAGLQTAPGASWPLAASLALSWGAAWRAALSPRSISRRARVAIVALGLASLGLMALSWGDPGKMLVAALLVPVAVVASIPPRRGRWRTLRVVVDSVLSHPARMLVVTFLGLSVVGALMLRLPGVSAAAPIAAMDAAFTATSAVCVTGLIVLDTPSAFTGFGQAILLLLIQVGGLGIMSFSTVAIAAFGRRLSLKHEGAIAGLFSGGRGDLFVSVRRLLVMTFSLELAGAVVLAIAFSLHGDPVATAIWRGLFTAVSAFCNAGFALQSDSLLTYQHSPLVLHVVALLIIVGGLSPAVVADLPGLLRRRRLALQTKVVLWASVTLLLLGAVLIAGLEWSGAFAHLDRVDRLHAAWFQSVTLRTAGFNSVDFAALAPATVWLMCAFMIVGGSPGGTAGGVKTTTVFILFAAVVGAMRGRWEAVGFGRRIPHRNVYKAASIVTIALVLIVFGVVALEVTQSTGLQASLFEVVSALGTVGLSIGATGNLDDVGKIIIMILMFVGRVGPLTLFLFLRERHSQAVWRLPEQEIDVG